MRNALLPLMLWLALPTPALAEEQPAAQFALLLGVNRSVDATLPLLHYADDDAAQYQELFRLLGARTYLLTRLDDNTRALHPQAAAEAHEPTAAGLKSAVEALSADVAQARERKVRTVLYVVYAGHGNVSDGTGYLTLEDARLTGADLAQQVVAKVGADQVHLIVDACYSYLLVYGRGAGEGSRRLVRGFSQLEALAQDGRVGLLLSTSSARESHEWEAYQAGVFSHEVRSGLYGAADADGDGRVSYREMAAFVERANAAIANERFRPDVFARPPAQGDELLDLRGALGRRLEIDGAHGAHYELEDTRGVRLADLHNGPDQVVHLLRPLAGGALYLRRSSDGEEYALPASPEVVSLAELPPTAPRVRARGAAHDAFDTLFSVPFSEADVASFRPRAPLVDTVASTRSWPTRRTWALVAGGVGVGCGLTALGFEKLASDARSGAQPTDSQQSVAQRNARIRFDNNWALGLGIAAGTSALLGAGLWFWPGEPPPVAVSATGRSATLVLTEPF